MLSALGNNQSTFMSITFLLASSDYLLYRCCVRFSLTDFIGCFKQVRDAHDLFLPQPVIYQREVFALQVAVIG